MKKIILLSSLTSAVLMASGYSIPVNSINSTALSGASIAHATGADASYYNPAEMINNENVNLFEVDTSYIYLTKVNYKGSYVPTGSVEYNIDSKDENFVVPSIFYTSKKLGSSDTRVGFSITSPAGLSKRWDSLPAVYSAKEFTLETIEFNPSMAVPINDNLNFGMGFRVVSSRGIVQAERVGVYSQKMKGRSIDYGYNVAMSYKPEKNTNLSITYRSKVNLSIEGDADITLGSTPIQSKASVSVPMPAVLNFAGAYTFNTGTTIELVYEKSFWSAYKSLDFDYANATVNGVFGAPKDKNWSDTNTFRLGVTQKYDNWIYMAGVSYDESPVKDQYIGFEIPEADAMTASIGTRYRVSKVINVGLAGLMKIKDKNTVNNASLNGEFSKNDAYVFTAGVEYKF
jgi:long-chain fatty acid transport protein